MRGIVDGNQSRQGSSTRRVITYLDKRESEWNPSGDRGGKQSRESQRGIQSEDPGGGDAGLSVVRMQIARRHGTAGQTALSPSARVQVRAVLAHLTGIRGE